MRAFAWLLLLFGPLLSLPVTAGLWAHEHLRGDDYVLAVVAGALILEALALGKRGLMREVAIVLLSGLWVGWMWLALTQADYDWSGMPAWRMPNPIGQMVIILAMLVYLMLYEVATMAPGRHATPELT